MEPGQLAIIIIAGNEQDVIVDCLRSALFADQVILVAANSTDGTVKLASTFIPKINIIKIKDSYGRHFAKWRNAGLKAASTTWVYYLDADERISLELKEEILKTISHPDFIYYVNPRQNYYLNHIVKYGGSSPDYVKRLFRRIDLRGWSGILHEEPIIEGRFGYLKSPLIHYTHRQLRTMIEKSLIWSDMEATALFKTNHPQIVWWRILRMMLTTFFQRLIVQQMWRDGTVGWVSVIFESFNTFLVYTRLWELQQIGDNKT